MAGASANVGGSGCFWKMAGRLVGCVSSSGWSQNRPQSREDNRGGRGATGGMGVVSAMSGSNYFAQRHLVPWQGRDGLDHL